MKAKLLLILALLSAVPSAARAQFTDPLTTTPAFLQVGFGPAGDELANGGQEFCVPVTTAMQLSYLGLNGFNQIAPSTPTAASELNLVQVLSGLAGTDALANGTNYMQMENALQIYLAAAGIGTANYSLTIKQAPTLNDLATMDTPGTVITLGSGYFDSSGNRSGGHAVSLLGVGFNALGQSSPNTIAVNNQLPNATSTNGDAVSNILQYLNVIPTTGALTADGALELDPSQYPGKWSSSKMFVIEEATVLTINTDELPSNNLTAATWNLATTQVLNLNSGTLPVLAPMAGTGGITLGQFGTLLSEASNTTIGANTIKNSSTWTSTVTSGDPFGRGSITIDAGTLSLSPTAGTASINLTAASGSGNTLTYVNGTEIALNSNGNTALTLTIGGNTDGATPNLVRQGTGTLVIAVGGGIGRLGQNESLIVAGAGGNLPPLTNGIVSSSIVGQNNDTFSSGDFLTYGVNGFAKATYTQASNTPIDSAAANSVYQASSNQVVAANTTAEVYALRVDATVSGGAGSVLEVGPQTSGQAGIILNGGTISTPTLQFGAAEGIVYANDAGGTISSIIQGSGGLTTFGPGTVTLKGANTYTGPTNINSGILQAQNTSGSATGSGNVFVRSSGALEISGAFANVGGANSTTSVNDGGALLLNGGNVSGTLTMSAGSFLFGHGTITAAATISGTIGNSGTPSQVVAYSGVEDITFQNAVTFNSSTLYSWKLNALDAAPADAGINWSLLNFNSGGAAVGTSGSAFNVTLDLGSTVPDPNSGNAFWNASHQWLIADDPQGFGSIFWNPGFSGFLQGGFSVSLDSASKDLYIDYTPKGVYWKGGTGGSWMGNNWASDSTGTPTVALPTITDDVIFSAAGAANQGATTLGQNFAIHSLTVMDPKPVVINSGAGGPFTLTVAGALGTGITVFAGSNLTINSNLTLGGESDTIEVDGTGLAAVNGILGGSNGLTKTGTGKLTLTNGGNNYTGGTTINGGLVSINNGGALGTGDVTLNEAALLATATTTLAGQVTFSSGTTSTLSAATGTTLTLTKMELDGNAIFGSAGNAGVVVAGPFQETGQSANSNIEVAFGTLRNGGGGIDLGSFTSTSGTTTTVNAGATLDLHDNSLEVINLQGAGAVTLGTNAATVLTLDSGNFSGVISGAGQLSAAGVTVILTGTNTYTGGTTISSGTLQLGNGGATGTILGNVTDNGNFVFDYNKAVTYGAVISGAGGVTQSGTGVLTLTGANTFSGGMNINSGELSIKSPGAIGTGVLGMSGGTFLTTATMTLPNQININPGATATVAAAPGTTLTVNNLEIGSLVAGNVVFGSAGNTGTVVIVATGFAQPNSTVDVAFGTLRNGGTANFVTQGIASTTVAAGATLDVHDNSLVVKNLLGTGAITLGTNAATELVLETSNFGGVISGAGLVSKLGPGTVLFTGTNTYTGGTVINAGTLQLGNGGMTGSIVGNVTNNGSLILDRSNAVTFAGTISGSGTLTQSGTNVLTLTGANTYSGGTTINAGEVSVKSAGALGTGNVTLNGGALLTTATMTLASQVGLGTNATATVSAASGTTLTLDQVALGINSAANAVFGSTGNTGVIVIGPTTGLGEFPGSTIKVAFGTLRNGGATGLGFLTESIASTTVNTGATLDVHDNSMEVANLQGAGAVTLGSSAATVLTLEAGGFGGVISGAGRLTITGPVLLSGTNTYTGGTTITDGTLQIGNGGMTGSITGNVALNADAANLTFDRNNALTFAGTISGSGTLTQAGTGALTLTGTNTYAGGTNINAGAVSISNVSALGTGSITLNGGGLHLTATMALSNDVVFGVGATSTVSTAAGTTLTLSSVEVDGNAVFGSTGQTGVIVIGPLTTSNATANATIDIAAGTVRNGIAGTTGLAGLTNFLASTTVAAGATLDVHDNHMEVNSLQGAGAVTLGTSATTVLFLDAGNFSGVISGAGQLTKATTGTLVLTGTNTYTGGTTINVGTLQIGNGGTAGSIPATGTITDNGNLTFDHSNAVTFGGVISGTGTLTQSGTGTLTLTGANTYSGGTTINAGAVSIKSPGALGTGGVTLDGGALLAAATMTLASEVTFNPGATSTLVAATGTTLTLSIVEVGLTGGGAAVFGSAGDTGTVVIGPGTAATDDASTIDVAFGTLRNGGNLGFFTNLVASTTVAVGATLDVHDLSMTVINLQGAGAITLGTNAATVLTLNAGSYSGVISGAGQLTKATTGTLALSGASTYSGGTTISAGTLLANNTAGSATGTGPVTIDSGAKLGGKGKITGAATLDSGGFIAPGAGSPGVAGTTLHAASLIWNGGGVITLQLGATGDALALTGPLTKGSGGAFTLDITNAGITKTTYTLLTFASTTFTETDFNLSLPVNYTGTLVETSTSLILEDLVDPPPPAGVESPTPAPATEPPTPGLADNGANGTIDPAITVIPTPEPASTGLLALGVAALLGRRRRK